MISCRDCIHDGVCCLQEITNDIEEQLREFGCENYKSKEDFVEVVRCKNCKHYDGSSCSEIAYIMDGYYQGTFELKRPTDFCSYAEERSEEK